MAIEATDPVGGTERLEFQFDSALNATETSVPTGFSAFNTNLDHYVTLYWDKRAMAEDPGDADAARQIHWLLSTSGIVGAHTTSASIPHSIKRPREGRLWYRYPGQTEQSATSVG